ncbi:putative quinol monooxygenase [Marisediminicola antarctica]|uniref:Monooxygenase n=1 Tax=Marisediminicola antarctica TaxID=674079 RepID=A0A7L5AIE0_9MICO|nr:monooxygenase [Marisediminicola antarctica]QHO70333.1 hypothetical protein BHD05_12430 [Marisediminicola antarctica]
MTALAHLDLRLDPTVLDTVPTVLNEVLAATRAWPGIEGLEVINDDANPSHVVVELWTTTTDHDAYAAWRTTPDAASHLGDALNAQPVKTVIVERIALVF